MIGGNIYFLFSVYDHRIRENRIERGKYMAGQCCWLINDDEILRGGIWPLRKWVSSIPSQVCDECVVHGALRSLINLLFNLLLPTSCDLVVLIAWCFNYTLKCCLNFCFEERPAQYLPYILWDNATDNNFSHTESPK